MSLAEKEKLADRFEQAALRILQDQLPIPVRRRWQPLRAGLMNLFMFEDERFPFADGRLLLRGSNGTGKSRVLAMTLPLLLDGSFKANRVEPDRDPNRQVAWNLLMDDQPSATGYSWLEFGRTDTEGTDHFVTIGIGMKAVRGQPIKPWFFITNSRIDQDFDLKSIDGVPLTRKQLAEAIGESGQMFETAAMYRRAVDEKLFRLGERYDPLIDLLLQLRQPQLAKKLDIDQLELALREALPPLSESLLDDAAEAFRDLDQYRKSLEIDRNTLEHVERFLRPYREHVARGVKRSLKELINSNNKFEYAQRDIRNLTERKVAAENQRTQTIEQRRLVRIEIESIRAGIEQLKSSPEMQTAQHLESLVARAGKQSEHVNSLQNDVDKAKAALQAQSKRQIELKDKVEHKLTQVMNESESIRSIAAPEELQNRHNELLTEMIKRAANQFNEALQLNSVHPDNDNFKTDTFIADFDAACKKMNSLADRFSKSARHLIQLNKSVEIANEQAKSARQQVERDEQSCAEKNEDLVLAKKRFANNKAELWQSILGWYEDATELQPLLPAIDIWSDQWHDWSAGALDADPFRQLVEQAKIRTIEQLTSQRERLQYQFDTLEESKQALVNENRQLESGKLIAPPRHNAGFRAMHGVSESTVFFESLPASTTAVPFWQLVDFVPSVPQNERGNWEGALHDAGILDALLTPDGALFAFDAAKGYVQIALTELPEQEFTRQLLQVLRPSPELVGQSELATYLPSLQRLLAVIGVGAAAGATWVANDGIWQNGPLSGQFAKDHPQYIGSAARKDWTKARIGEIESELSAVDSKQSKLQLQIRSLEQRKQLVERQAFEFPNSEPLVGAKTQLTLADSIAATAAETLNRSRELEADSQFRYRESVNKRDDDATDMGLFAWAERADKLETKIDTYVSRLPTVAAHVDTLATLMLQAQHDKAALADIQSHCNLLVDRLNSEQVELAKTEESVRVLKSSAGKSVNEMLERSKSFGVKLEERINSEEQLANELTDLTSEIAVVSSDITRREADSMQYDELRRTATDWFATMHDNSLIDLVYDQQPIPDLPWSMTAAIKLARNVDAWLHQTLADDESWQRSQSAVHQAQTELQQSALLQDGMSVEVQHLRDGLQMVFISVQGELLTPNAALARLQTDIENRKKILDAREQETLEKYLLGEVTEGLRNGMRMAEELINLMTSEVTKRPMKTGMQMRFKWKRDENGPPGLAEACEVLETDSSTWSIDEREQIKLFLQRSIHEQRELEQNGSWNEHMRSALDYRRWHRIIIERRSGPDANWQTLTRRTYGSGSGGEKAIALTLPQLAAAAAYYQSADPLSPRFILLDEAFAGISSDMRESCLELIAAFKLDVVMTSENEWGMYKGVHQLAICQLDRFSDVQAVVNRVFIWNGNELRKSISQSEAAEIENQPLFENK
jgi:uncharacterized protein (TIGR02680 family)